MLYRIVGNVAEMILEVGVTTDCVFPKAWLPNASPAPRTPRVADRLFGAAAGQPSLGELFFHLRPPDWIGSVALGQRPKRVKMIGQQDDSDDHEGPACTALAEHVAGRKSVRNRISATPALVSRSRTTRTMSRMDPFLGAVFRPGKGPLPAKRNGWNYASPRRKGNSSEIPNVFWDSSRWSPFRATYRELFLGLQETRWGRKRDENGTGPLLEE